MADAGFRATGAGAPAGVASSSSSSSAAASSTSASGAPAALTFSSYSLSLPSPVKRARAAEGGDALAPAAADGDVGRLLSENAELKEQLENAQAQLAALRSPRLGPAGAPAGTSVESLSALLPPLHVHHHMKTSKLPGGAEVRLSEDELAAMRQIFALFDKDGSGKVTTADLTALYAKLGEPLDAAEAGAMVADIGQGRDHISFEDFLLYWDGSHPSQRVRGDDSPRASDMAAERHRKRQHHQARFKFMKAKIANPAVGRIYTKTEGVCPSLEYRVRFYTDDPDSGVPVQISAWHDVPYKNPDGTYNMIVEIPKWSRRKFEIATGELYNPIKQDVKNGTLREYAWGDMIFNYGCVPQTWEDPKFVHPDSQAGGDNDPIDIVDVGAKMWSTGSIVRVKLLGVLAMIDDGETDWKLIGINAEDPAAELLNDIDDLAVHMPGASEALHRWLKYYKTPTINKFAFDGVAQPRAFAKQVLEETHEQWRKLVEAQGRSATVSK